MFTTRLARIDDAEAIAGLQLESWTARGIAHLSLPDIHVAAEQWISAIRDQQDKGRIVVVEKAANSILVGCAGVMRTGNPHQYELVLLEVTPNERRQSIGARLVNAAADIARGYGAESIHAWIGTDELAAVSLLESAGWQLSGAHRQKIDINSNMTRDEIELHTSLR